LSSIVRLFRRHRSDKSRFVTLIRPHVALMYRMAYRWSGSQADAEDLVQAVLARLATRVDELAQVDNLRPWLIKIVYRQFVDQTRLARNRFEVIESDLETDSQSSLRPGIFANQAAADDPDPGVLLDLQNQLEKALALLGDDQRDVILLHDAEGYTLEEVAEILEINTGTVKSRLHRARNRIKKLIGEGTL